MVTTHGPWNSYTVIAVTWYESPKKNRKKRTFLKPQSSNSASNNKSYCNFHISETIDWRAARLTGEKVHDKIALYPNNTVVKSDPIIKLDPQNYYQAEY